MKIKRRYNNEGGASEETGVVIDKVEDDGGEVFEVRVRSWDIKKKERSNSNLLRLYVA